jgi:hypothetical protein
MAGRTVGGAYKDGDPLVTELVWEVDRAVKQAMRENGRYDTVIRHILNKHLTAAAQVGEPTQTNLEIAREFCRLSFQKFFDLSDERTEEYAKVIGELLDHASHATIERCAQVAENLEFIEGVAHQRIATQREIAAAIRALKDKP